MFREATTFAGHLRTVEKDLGAWARDIDRESFRFARFRGALSALARRRRTTTRRNSLLPPPRRKRAPVVPSSSRSRADRHFST